MREMTSIITAAPKIAPHQTPCMKPEPSIILSDLPPPSSTEVSRAGELPNTMIQVQSAGPVRAVVKAYEGKEVRLLQIVLPVRRVQEAMGSRRTDRLTSKLFS